MCVSSPFFSFSTSQLRVVSELFALMHDTFSIPVCSQLSGPAQEPAVLFPIDQPTPQPLSTLSMPCPNQLCITRREKKNCLSVSQTSMLIAITLPGSRKDSVFYSAQDTCLSATNTTAPAHRRNVRLLSKGHTSFQGLNAHGRNM